ncbi:hypothetical protein PCASD_11338 [Puccinia coronata f. sp. avenae]|uniref:Uncharacterized protein n=1 Tax=Puccinia coronata f. sp. avenae TaxID=200324 RepID=A0A2N5UFT2_9BASI|nr:hypothetical protein PCASD_11338 [Puccinia coronata f. sp. avenae]
MVCSRCTPLWKGVQGLHAFPRTLHAMCMPTIGVHTACRRARQACRACTPFGQACRLCTPVGSRKPLDSRGLREPRYPYKGTEVPLSYKGTQGYLGTLIRVPRYPYKGTERYPYKGTERYPYKGTQYPYKGTKLYPSLPALTGRTRLLEQLCSTGVRTDTVRPKREPTGRTDLSDRSQLVLCNRSQELIGQACPTRRQVLRSDSACPTTGRTRLFEHRSNCRV